jgi:hypothetical protein
VPAGFTLTVVTGFRGLACAKSFSSVEILKIVGGLPRPIGHEVKEILVAIAMEDEPYLSVSFFT